MYHRHRKQQNRADIAGTVRQSGCGRTLQGREEGQRSCWPRLQGSCFFRRGAKHGPKRSCSARAKYLIQGIGREDGRHTTAERWGPFPGEGVGAQLGHSTSESLRNGGASSRDRFHSLYFPPPTSLTPISHLDFSNYAPTHLPVSVLAPQPSVLHAVPERPHNH